MAESTPGRDVTSERPDSEHDETTGLPNRRAASRLLKQYLLESRDPDEAVCVLSLRLRHSQPIGDIDVHGEIAEELMNKIATRVSWELRKTDVLCRIDDDEFALLCPNLPEEQVVIVVARLTAAIARPFQFEGRSIHINATVSVAEANLDQGDDDLFSPWEEFESTFAVDDQRVDDVRSENARADDLTVNDAANDETQRPSGVQNYSSGPDQELFGQIFEATLRAVDSAIVILDLERRVLHWNDSAERLYGWSASEAVGQLARDLIVPVDQLEKIPKIDDDLRLNGGWRGEFVCRRRDGSSVPVSVVQIPVRDRLGNLIAVVGASHDLTDHSTSELERNAVRAMADTTTDAVYTVRNRIIDSWSVGAQRLLGWSAEQAIGRSVDTFIPEDLSDEADELFAKLAEGFSITAFPTERLTQDGTRIPVSLNVTPIFDAASSTWLSVAVIHDRRTRDELLTAAIEAEARFRALLSKSTESVLVLDANGMIKAASTAVLTVGGLAPEQLVERSAFSLIHPDDLVHVREALSMAIDGVVLPPVLYRRVVASGEYRWAEATVTNLLDDPIIRGIVVNNLDVHEREEDRRLLELREAKFRSMFEHASDLAMVVDSCGLITEVTPSCRHMLNLAPDEVIGKFLGEILGIDVAKRLADARLLPENECAPLELPLLGSPKTWIDVEIRNLLHDPAVGGFVLNVRDVTARVTSTRELIAAESRWSAVINRSSDVALFLDADNVVRWVSPAMFDVLGVEPEALIGRHAASLIYREDRERVMREVSEALGTTGNHVTLEYRVYDRIGNIRWIEETATDLFGDPNVGYRVSNIRDITDRKLAHDELRRLALVDDLTNLPNRAALVRMIRARLEFTKNTTALGLLFFDLDDFCDVNDTLGHQAGDNLLVQVAQRVEEALPSGAILSRFSGDHFAVLCDDLESAAQCKTIAGVIRRSLDLPFLLDGNDVFATITVGIATTPVDDVDTLLQRADAAMQRGKKSGKGQVVMFDDELGEESRHRLKYTGRLRQAIKAHEIVPFYQPVIDIENGKVVGVEALARWKDSEGNMVRPDVFIPVAESAGLIGELGYQILEQSCRDAARWMGEGLPIQIAVNASAVQIMDPTFASQVGAILTVTGLDPDNLVLEITETAAIRDLDAAVRSLGVLRCMGINLSLDDFGTGYSSLSLLKRLPVDGLKLDRSFVSGLGESSQDDKIVTALVELAHAMGFFVVGEGVETQAQADKLRAAGCHHGQGYLWSPAVPADQLKSTVARIEQTLNVGLVRQVIG